jgi:hypothetical protein
MNRRLRLAAHALGAVACGLVVGLALTRESWELGIIGATLAVGLVVEVLVARGQTSRAAA